MFPFGLVLSGNDKHYFVSINVNWFCYFPENENNNKPKNITTCVVNMFEKGSNHLQYYLATVTLGSVLIVTELVYSIKFR